MKLSPEEWAAQLWARPENSSRVMDEEFAMSIAEALRELLRWYIRGDIILEPKEIVDAKRHS